MAAAEIVCMIVISNFCIVRVPLSSDKSILLVPMFSFPGKNVSTCRPGFHAGIFSREEEVTYHCYYLYCHP